MGLDAALEKVYEARNVCAANGGSQHEKKKFISHVNGASYNKVPADFVKVSVNEQNMKILDVWMPVHCAASNVSQNRGTPRI